VVHMRGDNMVEDPYQQRNGKERTSDMGRDNNYNDTKKQQNGNTRSSKNSTHNPPHCRDDPAPASSPASHCSPGGSQVCMAKAQR
jgi:hypothetical protein